MTYSCVSGVGANVGGTTGRAAEGAAGADEAGWRAGAPSTWHTQDQAHLHPTSEVQRGQLLSMNRPTDTV